ncbi:MAG TPA: prephenate dehydrogenase/arogenate dehydrogenase family protein [Thermoanaerobaculia bacterium]|nr:prephenate dehydrogenase/arogenate dehydrogenase family protein [Thermoanaerobaculia bacterium]
MGAAPRALIAGLGLIGGSIGIALRARGWHVAYVDPHVESDDARRAGAADESCDSLEAADLTVLATPVDVAVDLLTAQTARRTTTSVASVMHPLRAAAGDRDFIAGHPLAGSHERGLAAARGDLFRGCAWFVDRRDPLVERMIGDCGARMELVDAGEHDAAVALTSHLPQILSTALAAHLDRRGVDERFAGSGLKTFLRLAGSDASVWMPVLEANREAIAPHVEAVMSIVRSILAGDAAAFEQARRIWERLR